MKSVTNFVLTISAIAFWIFRIIVAICIVFIYKKNFLSSIVYFAMYAGYFGMDIYNKLTVTSMSIQSMTLNILVDAIGIVIAIVNFVYVIATSNKKTAMSTKKTDWFYQNEKFDRELDERADKNNYRIN